VRKILVVDKESTAVILVKLLQHCGYDAVFEPTGEAALKTAAVFEPDVIFIDLIMPDMSGYDIAQKLRFHRSNGKPKLISLTGYVRGQGQGDDSVFDDYLVKPVDVETFRKVIDGGVGQT